LPASHDVVAHEVDPAGPRDWNSKHQQPGILEVGGQVLADEPNADAGKRTAVGKAMVTMEQGGRRRNLLERINRHLSR